MSRFSASGPEFPKEYEGREQTWLKHRVLEEYVLAWAMKLGHATAARGERLWYVDVFAGPWKSKDAKLSDTSVSVGLTALRRAANRLSEKESNLKLGAMFVEKDRKAFEQLRSFVESESGEVTSRVFHGEFGNVVGEIDRSLGDDPAFLFVDPTGWKGADLRFIRPLVQKARRDVLINFMLNYVRRFKEHPNEDVLDSLRQFFALPASSDLLEDVDENGLMELYRRQLKETCNLQYAADLAIAHPTLDRTWFRLVVGVNHHIAIKLFRSVEQKVVGRDAATARSQAKRKDDERKNGTGFLFDLGHPDVDPHHSARKKAEFDKAEREIRELLRRNQRMAFADLWPEVLQSCRVTERELAKLVLDLSEKRILIVEGMKKNERSVKEEHRISLSG
jgi:three-Cys-motif partner protein